MASNASESASRVPTITALRTALQYGDLRLPRCEAFNASLSLFRKSYVITTGMRGTEARDWNSAEHQIALTEMSQAYLDRNGNGELYWPADPAAPNYNSMQYVNQQTLIRKCVRELLYRSNVQQHRNAKYRSKVLSLDGKVDDAHEYPVESIEISSEGEISRSTTVDAHVQVTTDAAAAVTNSGYDEQGRTTQRTEPISTVSSQTAAVDAVENDVFAIPDDYEWFPSRRTTSALKRNLKNSGGNQRPKRSKPSLQRRRPKGVDTQDAGGSSKAPPTPLLHGDSELGTDVQRTSDSTRDQSAGVSATSSVPVPTPVQRTPDYVINYIRSNRPLTTSEPATTLTATQSAQDSNVEPELATVVTATHSAHKSDAEPPINLALHQPRMVSGARLSLRGADHAPLGSHSIDQSRHTGSPMLPPQTVAGYGEPPEPNPVTSTTATPANEPSPRRMDTIGSVVQIKYRLVLTHDSIPTRHAWTPNGNLLSKTLQSLELEIPITEGYKGFILRLRTPHYGTELMIDAGDEFAFKCAKEDFLKTIRLLAFKHMRAEPSKALPMFVEVEPQESDDDKEDMKGFESMNIEF